MHLLISGYEHPLRYDLIRSIIKETRFPVTKVISTGTTGVAKHGERYAVDNGLDLEVFHPDFETYNKLAGNMRNIAAAKACDGAIIVWDGNHQSTRHLLYSLKGLKLPIYEVLIKETIPLLDIEFPDIKQETTWWNE